MVFFWHLLCHRLSIFRFLLLLSSLFFLSFLFFFFFLLLLLLLLLLLILFIFILLLLLFLPFLSKGYGCTEAGAIADDRGFLLPSVRYKLRGVPEYVAF